MYRIIITVSFSFLLFSCKSKTVFETVESNSSGIHFNNIINDDDSLNILDVENVYNGGGVGIGDFNNDGLQDMYFTANTVSNKLYLNKGDLKFDDITEVAGVNGSGQWSRGVSVVDINNDGLQDIYVCGSLSKDVRKRENLLYVNTGVNSNGIPRFKNMAAEYGLADTVHSTMAAFFDYDNDGDLDMYLLVNEIIKGQYPGSFKPIAKQGEHPNTDKLFRNDWSDSLKHPIFTDISMQAGITVEGFGHGVNIADINMDGWKDIYVANDFISNNLLYINNRDGSFTNQVETYFKHTSENSMGQDVIDINNDGLADVIELDMNPEDNYRKKMMMSPISYRRYQNNDQYGYQYQYVRNVLQINQGPRVLKNDSIGPPVFSDIAFYSGISETDWSWTPSVADFDNDEYRDLIVTNGFPKDVTDHDFTAFRNKAYNLAAKRDILDQIPQVKISNYAYKNNGDLTFKDVTKEWGMDLPTFSNGAAYADLDNDGDLDYVINNINDEALIYRNNSRAINKQGHYLQIKLAGDSLNKNGLGAFIELHYDGKKQVYENTPYRGYLSSVFPIAHFGLRGTESVDSVIIKWPGGKMQVLEEVTADQLLLADVKNATTNHSFMTSLLAEKSLFTEVSDFINIHFIHEEKDFVDFNIQKLIPHKLSEYGPALAVGDMDGNGLDDIICGGPFNKSSQLFFQQPDHRFIQKPLLGEVNLDTKISEDEGLLLFDADGDKDLDLYIASGGYESAPGSVAYTDKLYVNDGKGNYQPDTLALPHNLTSKFCVRAADYDKDGDLDLFIAGRVQPGNYPKAVSSFIYRNDSKKGSIKFTDVTNAVADGLLNIGLVCDAVFTDFNNDGWSDLVLSGEWMPVTFLQNNKGIFSNITASSGLAKYTGWWNSIVPGDFDNDGDIDYVAGNLGQNSFYSASGQYPVSIYAKDFDKNGILECVPTKYIKDKDGILKEFTVQTRDDVVDQMPFVKKRFLTYKPFAEATFDKLFTPDELKDILKLQANYLRSAFIKNNGDGKFEISPLPGSAQFSSLNGMVADDFDGDNNLDIVINTNDYGTEVSTGRYDALNGLVLKGNGNGTFTPLTILQSGIYIPGNGKAMVKLRGKNGKYLLAAAQNRGPLTIFELKKNTRFIAVEPDDISSEIKYKNGASQKKEFYYGSSFLSQSARFLCIDNNILSVTISNSKGQLRKVQ